MLIPLFRCGTLLVLAAILARSAQATIVFDTLSLPRNQTAIAGDSSTNATSATASYFTRLGQPITTGPNALGYDLTSVTFAMQYAVSNIAPTLPASLNVRLSLHESVTLSSQSVPKNVGNDNGGLGLGALSTIAVSPVILQTAVTTLLRQDIAFAANGFHVNPNTTYILVLDVLDPMTGNTLPETTNVGMIVTTNAAYDDVNPSSGWQIQASLAGATKRQTTSTATAWGLASGIAGIPLKIDAVAIPEPAALLFGTTVTLIFSALALRQRSR